jgi:hypothetical protein
MGLVRTRTAQTFEKRTVDVGETEPLAATGCLSFTRPSSQPPDRRPRVSQQNHKSKDGPVHACARVLLAIIGLRDMKQGAKTVRVTPHRRTKDVFQCDMILKAEDFRSILSATTY